MDDYGTMYFPPNIDYPVSLAIHHNSNGIETPVSGDMVHYVTGQDLKAYRDLQKGGK